MTVNLVIYENVKTDSDEFADLLHYIVDIIDQGYFSGYYPSWELKEEEEDDESN